MWGAKPTTCVYTPPLCTNFLHYFRWRCLRLLGARKCRLCVFVDRSLFLPCFFKGLPPPPPYTHTVPAVLLEQAFQVRVRAEGPTRVFEVSDSDRSGVLTASAGRVGDRLGTVWPDTGDPSGTTDCVPALNPIHFAFGRCVDLRVKIGSVGVSLIDGRPTELVYLLVSNVQVQFVETVRAKQIDVVLGNLEINNQVCV